MPYFSSSANLSGKNQDSPQFSPNNTDQRGGANKMLAIHIILYIICIPLGFPCFYLSWRTLKYQTGILNTSLAIVLLAIGYIWINKYKAYSNYIIILRFQLPNNFEQSDRIFAFGSICFPSNYFWIFTKFEKIYHYLYIWSALCQRIVQVAYYQPSQIHT